MFSLKILCAVDIINMLHTCYRNGGHGMKKSGIISQGCMPLNLYTYVLSELSRSRIIDRKATGVYYFDKELSSISLYDLSKVLHQGIPIGEMVTTNELRGSISYKDQYQPLVYAERALMTDISRQMQNMKLSDMVDMSNYPFDRGA